MAETAAWLRMGQESWETLTQEDLQETWKWGVPAAVVICFCEVRLNASPGWEVCISLTVIHGIASHS